MRSKKSVVCFDFDDVLTKKDSLTQFLSIFGHTIKELEYGIRLLEDNKHPKKFFKTIKKVVKLGKGIKYSRVEKVVFFLGLNKNAKEVLKNLKKNGYKIAIVSINDEGLIRKFLKYKRIDPYIDHIYAARLGVKNGLLTGKISGDIIRTEKLGAIPRIKKLYNVDSNNIVYIGDGLTDLPLMKRVGKAILFCPNPVTNAEVLIDKDLMRMQKNGRLFLVEDKDLGKIMEFIS